MLTGGAQSVGKGVGEPRIAARRRPARLERLAIDAESVASYREQLVQIAAGVPMAEAALTEFSDWQVVVAMESLWAAGCLSGTD